MKIRDSNQKNVQKMTSPTRFRPGNLVKGLVWQKSSTSGDRLMASQGPEISAQPNSNNNLNSGVKTGVNNNNREGGIFDDGGSATTKMMTSKWRLA
jgi:hypothetical protein